MKLEHHERSPAEHGVQTDNPLQAELVARLRGGGGDGGATGAESRDSYLSMYAEKKPDKVDAGEEKLASFTQCRLTHEALARSPDAVVLDPLGHMFNKEAVLAALLAKKLDKKPLPPGLEHVKSLKDDLLVLKLTLTSTVTKDSSEAKAVSAGNFQRGNAAPFCCPLTARQMNGKFRFVALRPSGLVCAAEAIKGGLRAAVDDMIGGQLNAQTVVPINGTEEEEDALWAHLMERRQAAAAASGKKKKRAVDDRAGDGARKTKKLLNGCTDMATQRAKASAKVYKAGEHAPEGATSSVYASLFTSSSVGTREETYGARNLSFYR